MAALPSPGRAPAFISALAHVLANGRRMASSCGDARDACYAFAQRQIHFAGLR